MTYALAKSLTTPSGSLDNTMLCFLNECGITELHGVPLPDPRRCSQELSDAIYKLLATLRVFMQNAGVDKGGEFQAALDGVMRLRQQAGAGASHDGEAGGGEMEQVPLALCASHHACCALRVLHLSLSDYTLLCNCRTTATFGSPLVAWGADRQMGT